MRAAVLVSLCCFTLVTCQGEVKFPEHGKRFGPVRDRFAPPKPGHGEGGNGNSDRRPVNLGNNPSPAGHSRVDPICLRHENHYASQERNSMKDILDAIWRNEEVVPDVVDCPPQVPLHVQYGDEVIHPGRRVSMTAVRQRPTRVTWLADPDSYYTLILPDVDIESRANRNNAEFFNWLVVNIPGNDVDAGQTLFGYLALEVVESGRIDHRYAILVYKQPGRIAFNETLSPSCGPGMFGGGRGPQRLSRDFARQYNLQGPVAGTFVYVDWDRETQDDILCEWRDCNNGDLSWYQGPLDCSQGQRGFMG